MEEITDQLIKRHGLDRLFDGLYFNYNNEQPHLFKNDILKNLKLDAYVDDDLSLLKHIAKENKKTKFYWLNRGREKQHVPDHIVSINSLTEIRQ